jgi:hypothetical protein
VVATLLATGITQVLLDRRQAMKSQRALAAEVDGEPDTIDGVTLPPNPENS